MRASDTRALTALSRTTDRQVGGTPLERQPGFGRDGVPRFDVICDNGGRPWRRWVSSTEAAHGVKATAMKRTSKKRTVAVESYFTGLLQTRASGGATQERSLYGPL